MKIFQFQLYIQSLKFLFNIENKTPLSLMNVESNTNCDTAKPMKSINFLFFFIIGIVWWWVVTFFEKRFQTASLSFEKNIAEKIYRIEMESFFSSRFSLCLCSLHFLFKLKRVFFEWIIEIERSEIDVMTGFKPAVSKVMSIKYSSTKELDFEEKKSIKLRLFHSLKSSPRIYFLYFKFNFVIIFFGGEKWEIQRSAMRVLNFCYLLFWCHWKSVRKGHNNLFGKTFFGVLKVIILTSSHIL